MKDSVKIGTIICVALVSAVSLLLTCITLMSGTVLAVGLSLIVLIEHILLVFGLIKRYNKDYGYQYKFQIDNIELRKKNSDWEICFRNLTNAITKQNPSREIMDTVDTYQKILAENPSGSRKIFKRGQRLNNVVSTRDWKLRKAS